MVVATFRNCRSGSESGSSKTMNIEEKSTAMKMNISNMLWTTNLDRIILNLLFLLKMKRLLPSRVTVFSILSSLEFLDMDFRFF